MSFSPPVNVKTCSKGSFWSQEIQSGKLKDKPQCCPLFTNDPAKMPLFCPPTTNWCKYEEDGGKWSAFTKTTCCKYFGENLPDCKKTSKVSSGGMAPPAKVGNK